MSIVSAVHPAGARGGQCADEGVERGVQEERTAERKLRPPNPPAKKEPPTGSEEPVF
jgi:hypothetical protein